MVFTPVADNSKTNMQLQKDKNDQLNAQAWDVRVSDSTLAFRAK
jgi:hypothetical protein